jgi:hypothetical protein
LGSLPIWCAKLQLVIKGDGLKIHDFDNDQNIHDTNNVKLYYYIDVYNYYTWLCHLKALKVVFKWKRQWKHWLQHVRSVLKYFILIRSIPNCSTCSHIISEILKCTHIKILNFSYFFDIRVLFFDTILCLSRI